MPIEAKEALKKAHEIVVEFAKQMATTSAAILALFASLVSAEAIDVSGHYKITLALLFVSLIACILCTFWLMLSVAGTLDAVAFPDRNDDSKKASLCPSIYRTNIRVPMVLVAVTFLAGLCFLLVIVLL